MHERPPMLSNPKSARIRKVIALGGRSARRKTGMVLVEGPQAVRELLLNKPEEVVDVYVDESHVGGELYDKARAVTRWVHPVTSQVSRAISQDSQGITAVALDRAVIADPRLIPEAPTGFAVALPETQDPGNLGAMIRSASAFGAKAVFVGKGSVDPMNPKVIRASTGSVFQVPIFRVDLASAALSYAGGQATVLGTSGDPDTANLDDLLVQALESSWEENPLLTSHIWVFGNEARGLPKDLSEQCDLLVSIPIRDGVESLNAAAAAAICLHSSHLVAARR